MKRKFVVTKTNMSDDPSNRRNERTEKLKFLLSRDICVSSLIYDSHSMTYHTSVPLAPPSGRIALTSISVTTHDAGSKQCTVYRHSRAHGSVV